MKSSARILLNTIPVVAWASIVFLAPGAGFAATETSAGETDSRISETRHYLGGRGDNAVALGVSRDEYRPVGNTSVETATQKSTRENVARKPYNTMPSPSLAPNDDFWFYSVDVELFRDTDRDGYFAGIDLLFDADTLYASAEVYAVVYLSLDGGDWVEYAATEDFSIFGTSSSDSYNIVTDLIDGYPTGSYDILIELFDAWNGDFIAYAGPEDASALAFLPLEDRNNDAPIDDGTTVVVNRGGGGATGLLSLLVLAGAVLVIRRRQLPAAS